MKITKIKYGKYALENNGENAVIEFSRNGRYDTFDGKYHPAWLLIYNGDEHVCLDKESAIKVFARCAENPA